MWTEMSAERVNKVRLSLPLHVLSLLNATTRRAVAGGFIRDVLMDVKPVDIDLFVTPGYGLASISLQTVPVNIVEIDHNVDVTTIYRTFDFTQSMATVHWGPGKWVGYHHKDFLTHCEAKQLVAPNPAKVRLHRLLKFIARGWKADTQVIAQAVVNSVAGTQFWLNNNLDQSALLTEVTALLNASQTFKRIAQQPADTASEQRDQNTQLQEYSGVFGQRTPYVNVPRVTLYGNSMRTVTRSGGRLGNPNDNNPST